MMCLASRLWLLLCLLKAFSAKPKKNFRSSLASTIDDEKYPIQTRQKQFSS